MLNRILSSSTLLLSYFTSQDSTSDVSMNQIVNANQINNRCQISSEMNTALAHFFQNQNVSPFVDICLIRSRILAAENQCELISNMILEISQQDAMLKEYINLVFTQSKEFQISIVTDKEYEKIKSGLGLDYAAGYARAYKTIIIPESFLHKDERINLYKTLRHELRHAAMHIANLLTTGENNSLLANYGSEKYNTFVEALHAGDNAILKLKEYLDLELEQKLTDVNVKNLLNELRGKLLETYASTYVANFSLKFRPDMLRHLNKVVGSDIQVGTTLSSAHLLATNYGLVTITSIQNVKKDIKKIQFKINDPLYGIIYSLNDDKKQVQSGYRNSQYLHERDAYLIENIPPFMLLRYYENYLKMANESIQKAREIPLKNNYSFLEEIDPICFNENIITNTLNGRIAFNPNSFFEAALCIKKINPEEAVDAFKTLISRGAFVGESNLELARFAYQKGNTHAAVTYFKRAEKNNISVAGIDARNYISALQAEGLSSIANKKAKKLWRVIE